MKDGANASSLFVTKKFYVSSHQNEKLPGLKKNG